MAELEALEEVSLTHDAKHLLQKLQIYQIELEMQNQELQEAQRALEESIARYKDLYDEAPTGYLTLDGQGRIQEINRTGTVLLGMEYARIIGKPFSVWVVPQDISTFFSYLKRVLRGGKKIARELRLQLPDKKTIFVHLESLPVRGKANGALNCRVALLDISARVEAEAQLQQHREELTRLGQLSLLREFGTGLAHEINQPLGVISLYAQECMRQLRAGQADEGALLGAQEAIILQVGRASGAIRQLRQWLAGESDAPQRGSLNSLIHQALESTRPRLNSQNITVSVIIAENLPLIWMEPLQIEQVLLNLLSNAADAMASEFSSHRQLTLTATRRQAQVIEVQVSDSGPGLPSDQPEQLFEPFFTTKPLRLGLGLTLSRRLIENHGGRLWVTLNKNRGVTFRFTLPISETCPDETRDETGKEPK